MCTRVGNSVVDFSSGLETDGVVKVWLSGVGHGCCYGR